MCPLRTRLPGWQGSPSLRPKAACFPSDGFVRIHTRLGPVPTCFPQSSQHQSLTQEVAVGPGALHLFSGSNKPSGLGGFSVSPAHSSPTRGPGSSLSSFTAEDSAVSFVSTGSEPPHRVGPVGSILRHLWAGRRGNTNSSRSPESVPCSWPLAGEHGRTKDALGSVVNADRLRSPGCDSCTGFGWA